MKKNLSFKTVGTILFVAAGMFFIFQGCQKDDYFDREKIDQTIATSPELEGNRLRTSFIHCEKLQRHVRLLLKRGSMYKVYNGNLLYHGCVPLYFRFLLPLHEW